MTPYSGMLGIGLFIVGLFVGHGVATTMVTVLPQHAQDARMVGALLGGVLVIMVDLVVRRFWGEDEGWRRYVLRANGPSLGGAPGWFAGVVLVLIAFGLRN